MKNAKRRIMFLMIVVMLLVAVSPATLKPLASSGVSLNGYAHIQTMGNTQGTWNGDTLSMGTTGQSKRLEAININLKNNTGLKGGLKYRVHRQTYGWTDWVDAGTLAGTTGESKRLEAIEIKLTGDLAEKYSVQYRAHAQTYGWNMGWVSDGQTAGTTGQSKRLEALDVKLVEKGGEPAIQYKTHRQSFGWETSWAKNGDLAGTTGQSKRLEAITMRLVNKPCQGEVNFCSHIQNEGWGPWVRDNELSGTVGASKRLEAIKIKLSGTIANRYDVFYRVHAQNYGWLNWAKNGEPAGTEGLALRLEAIQVVLLPKGKTPPPTYKGVTSTKPKAFISASGQTPTPQPTGHTCEYPKFNSVPKEFKDVIICVNGKHYEWIVDVIIPTNSKGEPANECGYCHQVFYGDFVKHIKESHPDNWLNYYPYYEPVVGYRLMN